MSITNGYCTLAELKHQNRLNIDAGTDRTSDEMLEGIIEAVSRRIDDECHRRFWIDTSAQTRYYTPKAADYLFVEDIASTDSDVTVAIDVNGDGTTENTFTASDFNLLPYSANGDGLPYQKIEVTPTGSYSFPTGIPKGVTVNAKFGWPAVPPAIKQATLLQSERLFKRFATPLGSESMTSLGRMTLTIPSLDPDVEILISRYIKPTWG